jgi:Beta protein
LRHKSGTASLINYKAINEFPDRDKWRTMTVVGTGFPIDLSQVSSGIEEIPRLEFFLWNNLVSEKAPTRIPTFGDYTASHFESVEGDPRLLTPSANIRYALNDSWLVVKGGPVRGPYARKLGGYDQFYGLSSILLARPEFMGEDFSWGDKHIARCARRQASTGNTTTWRQVAVNHHITVVQRQVSSWTSPEADS